jgi:DNA-binding beta-propeller fold protein YncE
MWRLFIFISIFLISCSEEDMSSTETDPTSNTDYDGDNKLYVCDQTSDAVYIYDALTHDRLDSIPINFSGDEAGIDENPHFVAIDEANGYWFVTTSQSGYVGMYDLETDTLIHYIEVSDNPALLAVDDETQTLYVSRMAMPGSDMEVASKLDRLDYSGGLSLIQEEQVCLAPTEDFLTFPGPHAISFSNETYRPGGTLISASMSAAWLTRTDIYSTAVQIIHQPFTEDNISPDYDQFYLYPLAVAQKDDYAFFSCSGSSFENVNGQVQSWVVGDMLDPSLKSIYEFEISSMLWHIIESPIENQVFVVLSGGDNVGVACLSYDNGEEFLDVLNNAYDEGEEFTDLDGNGMYDEGEEFIDEINGVYDEGEVFEDTGNGVYDSDGVLKLVWQTTDSSFDTLHGITASADGSRLYISSRGDGAVHILDAMTGTLLSTISTGGMMLGGIAITQSE